MREAHRGTLFLDEIGDMPIEAQTRLLRVLQEREVVPVGASRPEKVDVRVVAATHQDLDALIAAGKFRADLYARLREHEVVLPPLRERREDLVPLCRLLLRRHGRPDLALGLSFLEPLASHAFPYNVRELEHVVTRALALLRPDARSLTQHDLPEALRRESERRVSRPTPAEPATPPTLPSPELRRSPAQPEETAGAAGELVPEEPLRAMLRYYRGQMATVAKALGVSRHVVYKCVKLYGIDVDALR